MTHTRNQAGGIQFALRRLTGLHPLSEDECRRIEHLSRHPVLCNAGSPLYSEDGRSRPDRMTLIVHGWLARARILSDGRRQIFNFILPGDIVAPDERFSLPTSIIALTPVEAIDLRAACQTIRRDTGAASGIERAYGQAVQAEYHLILDHIVRLGALSAVERVAHLLLELDERLSDVGLVDRDRFVFPVRQEHLADSLGMSLVHMNRSLQRLRHDNLIGLTEGWLTLLDRRRLAAIAHFDRGAGASARRQDLGADLILGSARSRQAKSDRLLPARADTGQSAVALDG